MRWWILAVVLLTVADPCRTRAASDPPADSPVAVPTKATEFLTEEQLVQAFRAKQFALIVQETFRIQKTPTVLVNFSQFRLLVLRGESYLQMRNYAQAQQTFGQAAGFAPDEDRRAVMAATASLVQKQVGGKYVTRTSGADGTLLAGGASGSAEAARIDVLDLGQRAAALNALSHDTLARARELLSRSYGSLQSLEPVFKAVNDCSTMERAATGRVTETRKLQLSLGELAGLIIRQPMVTGQTTLKRITGVHRAATRMMNGGTVDTTPRPTVVGSRVTVRSVASEDIDPVTGAVRHASGDPDSQLEALIDMTEHVPTQTKELVKRLELDPTFYSKIDEEAVELNLSARVAQASLLEIP